MLVSPSAEGCTGHHEGGNSNEPRSGKDAGQGHSEGDPRSQADSHAGENSLAIAGCGRGAQEADWQTKRQQGHADERHL